MWGGEQEHAGTGVSVNTSARDAFLAMASPMDLDAPASEQIEGKSESEIARRVQELENSIHHLVRSNKELDEYMAENGFDKELKVAIGENVVIIARRRAIVEELEKQISGGVSLAPPSDAQPSPPISTEAEMKDADGGVYL